MSATLEFPPLYEVEPAGAPAKMEIAKANTGTAALRDVNLTEVALAQFGDWRAEAKAATATLTGVQHDLSTPAKIADAKSLRQRLISTPLAEARKVSKALKSKLTLVSAEVGAELVDIEENYKSIDKLISPQIDAREQQLATEKAERDRLEAERVAAHRSRITAIAECVAKAQGLPSERIATGIAKVEAIPVNTPDWQEFAEEAVKVKGDTLDAMRALFDSTLAQEVEQQRLEDQRIDNARIAAKQAAEAQRLVEAAAKLAAEQKEAADKLAAERAELDRMRAELEALKAAATPAALVTAEKAEPVQAEPDIPAVALVAQPTPVPECIPAPAQHVMVTLQAVPASTAQKPEANSEIIEQPTIKLGDINARIAPLSISADGLAQLGFIALPVKGAARMYLQNDLPEMIAAMVTNLTTERHLLAA